MNRIELLATLGQSVWLDAIDRRLLDTGELARLIDEGVSGLTSNPSIFEKAIAGSDAYDGAIAALADQRLGDEAMLERLVTDDIRRAADLFRPVYEHSSGGDGYVSIEVPPALAHDASATIAAARRLWASVERPNAMVKIPATREGLAAIRTCLAEGINVNATLIFSVERYLEVIDAYRAALEARAAAGASPAVASVASFFVSRVDTAVDAQIEQRMATLTDSVARADLARLLGKAAVANAARAYAEFRRRFSEPWFERLQALGARPQRPVWASTGVKNPQYSPLLYCEPLIGRDTVNTLPPATLATLREIGTVRPRLHEDAAEALATLAALQEHGIDLAAVTASLETQGVALFAQAYERLLQAIAAKRPAAAPGRAVA
ncbi:MAG: transaldolase [Sinimarinibacterium sp.]